LSQTNQTQRVATKVRYFGCHLFGHRLNCFTASLFLASMSTQPCIPPAPEFAAKSSIRLPASAGLKGVNVTSAGWQVTPVNLLSGRSSLLVPLMQWHQLDNNANNLHLAADR